MERDLSEAIRNPSSKHYELLVQAIEAIILEVDARTFQVTFVNEAAERILGYPAEQWRQQPAFWADHLHPDDRQRTLDAKLQVAAKQEDGRFEYRMIAADGRVVWLRDIVKVNTTANSVLLRCVMVDITESKRFEAENQKLFHEFGERVKELTTLHTAAQILQRQGSNTRAVLRELAALLPRAFQYPHQAAVRLRLGRDEAATSGFVDSPTALRADFVTSDRQPGSIEVVYSADDVGRPPFAAEEQALINTLADMLRTTHDRWQAEIALRESEERYRMLATAGSLIVWTTADGRYYYAPGWVELTGQTEEEAGGDGWLDVLHPDDRERAAREWAEGCSAKSSYSAEYRVRVADGSYKTVISRSVPILRAGRVHEWVGVIYDITEWRQAETSLRNSEGLLAEAQRLAHIGNWNCDVSTKVVTWSDELYRIFGVDPQSFTPVFEQVLEYVHPEDRDLVKQVVETFLTRHEPFSFFYRIVRPDGQERHIHAQGNVARREGEGLRMFGTAQDVTERRLAEEQIRTFNERLRALSARMQSVREEESIRIARELHDQLGSVLTGFKWDLEMLSEMLSDTVAESRLQEARAKTQLMTHAIVDTVAFVRRISSELRPSILDLGVIEAIRWQAKQFQSRTGIPCVCASSHDDVPLSAEQATAVFRILQESLTNILRHARATNVEIRAEHGSGEFVVSVTDDGRGIMPEEASGGESLGLLGMQERAHLVGGSIHIAGVEGKGTTLTLRLPLADEIEHRKSESPSSPEYANEADSNSGRSRGSP